MADQKFTVKCGFFHSVNQDRRYYAEDMNRPYKRIITNGVFATPAGTPSDDLQIFSGENPMDIIVKRGEGLFGDKWFENPVDLVITVPLNGNIVPRKDSVIVQVDKRHSERNGNIIYREGTATSNPEPPALTNTADISEYRLANIDVASGATEITLDVISDRRGSAECPWITSLIEQMDTSTLFEQWQYAYEMFYKKSQAEFNEKINAAEEIIDELESENFEKKSVYVSTELLAANWNTETKIYSFEETYPSDQYHIELEAVRRCTPEQQQAWAKAIPMGSDEENVLEAFGEVPTVDIPILLTVRKIGGGSDAEGE